MRQTNDFLAIVHPHTKATNTKNNFAFPEREQAITMNKYMQCNAFNVCNINITEENFYVLPRFLSS